MKYLIAILIASILLAGGWYGISKWRRSTMIHSGRVLLLINKKAGTYTYSDLIKPEDLGSNFSIAGYADVLSDQEIQLLTSGRTLVLGTAADSADPRVPARPETSVVVPTPEEQKKWSAALATLSQEEQKLCASVQTISAIQPCFANHLIFDAIKANRGANVCSSFYISTQREQCQADIVARNLNGYIDADGNGLIDVFERDSVPYEQRTNTLNLPVINPGA